MLHIIYEPIALRVQLVDSQILANEAESKNK